MNSAGYNAFYRDLDLIEGDRPRIRHTSTREKTMFVNNHLALRGWTTVTMPFADLIRTGKARHEEATRLVDQALAMDKPRLELRDGEKALLLSPGIGAGAPYRITSFDEHGPIGHRDYDVHHHRFMVDEVMVALAGGLVPVKPI